MSSFATVVLCFVSACVLQSAAGARVLRSEPSEFESSQIEKRAVRPRNNRNQHTNVRHYVDAEARAFIVNEHNKYRKQVGAANMQYMSWDEGLAQSAQRHADRCDFYHSRDRARNTGENIWADSYPNYKQAVYLWNRERSMYNCGPYFSHSCGHYTQVVWATSTRVGCGVKHCSGINPFGSGKQYIMVCQYGPAGNKIGRPAFKSGAPCSQCPKSAPTCHDGLCMPR